MDRPGPRGVGMRVLTVGIVLAALTAVYLLTLSRFHVSELPGERHFGAEGPAEPAGEVYFETVGIDAFNDAMELRAYLMPGVTAGRDAHAASDRDLTLLVDHDKTVEELRLAAGDHLASSTFEVDLNEGSVTHYPLDSYVARVTAQLMEGRSLARLPVRVTMWEGLLGYTLRTTSEPASDPDDVQLKITIARSGAFALFAICAYGAMVLLAVSALVMCILTFAEVRPAETGLIGSLAAMAFALPALRDALPGSPPLGVEADMWVFLWAELAVVLSLGLVVFKWARAGPSP
jgi:Domain of unknown function (DUF4436)